jgi:hypothetical protein
VGSRALQGLGIASNAGLSGLVAKEPELRDQNQGEPWEVPLFTGELAAVSARLT